MNASFAFCEYLFEFEASVHEGNVEHASLQVSSALDAFVDCVASEHARQITAADIRQVLHQYQELLRKLLPVSEVRAGFSMM